MTIFVDMDGVLADFDAGVRALGLELDSEGVNNATDHLTAAQRELKEEAYERINAAPDFFANLPLMPGALELWAWASRRRGGILTAAPRRAYGFEKASREKWAWAQRRLPDPPPRERFIVTLSSKKAEFCRPGDILIDDRLANCLSWRAAGGVAIQHVSARQSIAEAEAAIERARALRWGRVVVLRGGVGATGVPA